MSAPFPPQSLDDPASFASPAGRADAATLQEEVEACVGHPLTAFLLDVLQGHVVILNEQRQILAANAALMEALGPGWSGPGGGDRPGEAFGCVHAAEGPDGCGTSRACAHCGYLLALLAADEARPHAEGECRMAVRRQGRWEARDFHVRASFLPVGRHRFRAVAFRDIGGEKRRDALERLFFHDMANILQGLRGWSESLYEGTVRAEDAAHRIVAISDRLGQEVHAHRRLLQAERGALEASPALLQAAALLQEVAILLARHPASGGRRVETLPVPLPATFTSDPDLLLRVVYNMALNALEATPPDQTVRLSFGWQGNRPRFAVHNPGAIPPHVQTQIFHRSFSTKADRGRGLGTYAMKLFGENLLRGQVGFESSPEAGTTFWILLPPRLEALQVQGG